ncbi:OFA family MFS transporter [Sporomusa sp. KB1]|jgi:OFA family oxalate/formate antiporter-like MFS transporter|uniref:L-lactate MFS transporter n=1 Tax=Sporomusa sp. KB1 TaxID=943346 RepID=UPI0011A5DC3E|nr:OFA family MFS transporter [Sporomusa sp. KB1]TWH47639.1 OFA family oxalate/formate antiporter-like MFS transporter [Sporomusa sp. KB1]
MNEHTTNRWRVFASGWLILFMLGAVAIFSVLAKPMVALRGWSMTDLSLAYSIYTFCFAICGIFSGRAVDLYGAKKSMYLGAFLFGGGWFFTGMCESLTQLYFVYGVIAGGGGGIMYNPVIAATLRWFPDKRGKISGMLLASASIGPFILAPLASIALEKAGVTGTFELLGSLFFITIIAVGWMMDSAPANYKPKGWNPVSSTANTTPNKDDNKDYEWKDMLSTPLFYMLLAVFICASTAGAMMVNSTAVIAQTQISVAATVGALAVSISTMTNFIGRLFFGAIYDKIGGFKSLLLSLAMTCVALILIGSAKSMPLFITCVIILGFAFGGLLVAFPPITGKYFGTKNLGVNYGIMFLGYSGGCFVGPRLSSYFFDTTGSFAMAYISAAGLAVLGAILVGIIMLTQKRQESAALVIKG